MANKLGRNDPCWCGSGKKYKKCHEEFDNKIAWYKSEGHIVPDHSMIKTPEQIEKIRESCRINIAVLDYVAENIRVGMTTQEIDDLVSQKTAELGGIPADYDYRTIHAALFGGSNGYIYNKRQVLKEIKEFVEK